MIHKYGYSSPTDGTYTIDNIVYETGVDYRTKERYAEYHDVGFDTLLLQGNDPYCGEDFETSQLKKNMQNAYSAGLSRIIVYDKRIYELSQTKGGLLGKHHPFITMEELIIYIRECLKEYSLMPGFIGVMLVDEPTYEQFDAIGQLLQAVKAINQTFICQCNLLPLNYNCESKYCGDPTGKTKEQCYREYVTDFCKKVELENIAMDSYPIREEPELGKFIASCHFAGLQIFSDILRDYHREKTLVLQSTAMNVCGKQKFRRLNAKTLAYQYHLALCLGVSDIAYFTYWRKQVSHSDWESFPDETSFISQNGIKTELYDAAQKMHASSLNLEESLSGFHYVDMTVVGTAEYILNVEKRIFSECDVESDGVFLMTKLEDDSGNRMISVVNIEDPDLSIEPKTIRLTFHEDLSKQVVVGTQKKLIDKILDEKLDGGECAWVFLSNTASIKS